MPINHSINITADTYAELREAIAELAEQHGVAVGRTSAPAEPKAHPHSADTPSTTAVDDQDAPEPEPEPADEPAAEDAQPELVWYHQPDERAVWQEEKQGRRKGIYQINEKTAKEMLAQYDAEEAARADYTKDADEPQAENEAGEQSEPAPAAEETPDPSDDEETPKLTLDDVRHAVMAFAKANGNPQGKALVEKYGASKISEIPENEWPALYDEAKAGVA